MRTSPRAVRSVLADLGGIELYEKAESKERARIDCQGCRVL